MKNQKKQKFRLTGILLTLCMVLAMLPITAFADTGNVYNKNFIVDFDSRGDDPATMATVQYQIGDNTPVDVTAWELYNYTDGTQPITFILKPSADRADFTPRLEIVVVETEAIVRPELSKNADGTFSFTVTPNENFTPNDASFAVNLWWSEFDFFGPEEDQFMIQTNVPDGDEDGEIWVDRYPDECGLDGGTWKYLCEEIDYDDDYWNEKKFIYLKTDEEYTINVVVRPNNGMVLSELFVGEDSITNFDSYERLPDGSCIIPITIPAASDADADNHVYVEALFEGADAESIPAGPANLRWEGNVAKWDPVDGADNYGICLVDEDGWQYFPYTEYGESYISNYVFTDGACEFDFSEWGTSGWDVFIVFATKNNVSSDCSESPRRFGYTIAFDANGGTLLDYDGEPVDSFSENTRTNGQFGWMLEEIPTPVAPVEGTFYGWYTAASGGTKVTEDTVFTEDTTVYAHWTADSVTSIDAVEITGATLSYNVGDAPKATAVAVDSDKYEIVYESWEEIEKINEAETPVAFWYSDESQYQDGMTRISTFEAGKTYIYSIVVKAKGSNIFAENATLKVNDIVVSVPLIMNNTPAGSLIIGDWIKTIKPKQADTSYQIIEGANGVWTQNSDGTLTFRANGDFSKFVCIAVDQVMVDESYYTASSGSTVITLKKEFLEKLSVGAHELWIQYTDGGCSTNFEIKTSQSQSTGTTPTEPNTPTAPSDADKTNPDTGVTSPQTGDNSHLALWIALLVASVFGIAGTTVYSRRKRVR